MHQLKYGKAKDKDARFSVFEFRREVARSIWANLNVELNYFTNANDERFSIQAEKDILRNLLVHLAEIPLGYPVYASGAQTVYFWELTNYPLPLVKGGDDNDKATLHKQVCLRTDTFTTRH